jgi:hypothetical protein
MTCRGSSKQSKALVSEPDKAMTKTTLITIIAAMSVSACITDTVDTAKVDDAPAIIKYTPCSTETIGVMCERDDGLIGVCVAPRKCLTECDTVDDCTYENGKCVDSFCWYSGD